MGTQTSSTSTTEHIAVGDFFVCSWGYDQTNVDFYRVVGKTGKSVRLQWWTKRLVSEAGMPTEFVVPGGVPATVPVRENGVVVRWEDAKPEMKRVNLEWGTRVRINSFSSARLWEGDAEMQTGGGWGH